jgi:hypothetical protein
MKYRIVEYTNPHGDKRYRIQEKWFGLFWTSPYPSEYDFFGYSYEEALKEIDILRASCYTVTNKIEVRE